MISDVLSDAVSEIERYERSFPQVYGPIREKLAEVKATMEHLRIELDTPPNLETDLDSDSNANRRNQFWAAFHALPSVRLWKRICVLPLPIANPEGIRAFVDGKDTDLPALLEKIETELISGIRHEAKCDRLQGDGERLSTLDES